MFNKKRLSRFIAPFVELSRAAENAFHLIVVTNWINPSQLFSANSPAI